MKVGVYIMRRLLVLIPTFLGISIITFLFMYMAGDPISLIRFANPAVKPETLDALRHYYGLDQPIPVQYLMWLWKFFHLDMGVSLRGGRPVNDIIWGLAWETVKLQLAAFVLSIVVAIPVAVNSARKQYSKQDMLVTTASLFGICMPPFWLGALLILTFSITLGWLPAGGARGITPWPTIFGQNPFLDEIAHLILPSVTIAYVNMALFIRLLRSQMLEVLREDFITALRASGLTDRIVIYKHALKNAIRPTLTYIGIRIGYIFAGAPMTETVFSWPGLGYEFVTSALVLDFPVVMAIVMIISIMMMGANLAVDICYAMLDPRIRIE